MTHSTQIKGFGILSSIAALERLSSRQAVEQILADCPRLGPMVREQSLTAHTWYPSDLYVEFSQAMRRRLGPDISAQLSRATTLADVNSLFRFVLHLISPQSITRFASRIIGTYIRGAGFTLENGDYKSMQGHFFNAHGWSQGLFEEVMAGTASFVELAGARNCRFSLVDGGKDGDTWVRFQLTWD